MAFGEFRSRFGPPLEPMMQLVRDDDELDPMTWEDGLERLAGRTGPTGGGTTGKGRGVPDVPPDELRRLWAIRSSDVVHAAAFCEFGTVRSRGEVKHTNLTGGEAAFGGGEFHELGDGLLLVNGDSGRYRLRSEEALSAVFDAFVRSGYGVWGVGWDHEGNRPAPFNVGRLPTWVG